MRKFLPLLVFLLCSVAIVTGQTGDDDDVITVDSTLVRLNVGVVNQTGRPIKHLTAQDFALFEDGVKQKILNFEPTQAPFSVVMMLDMSGSTQGIRQNIRLAAGRFVDALGSEDRVAVLEFYDKINWLNDFSSERSRIYNSIQVANGKGKTQLYKALELALDKLSKEGSRRKAIIVLTDGVDSALRDEDRKSLVDLEESKIPQSIKFETAPALNAVLDKASKQGVTVYPLALPSGDPSILPDPTPAQVEMYGAARKRLDLLATRTGGQLNAITRMEEIGKLYVEVAASLRSLYTIEYQPTNASKDGKWREIKVELNMTDLVARTRPGYFAK
ncbi:MAG: VWA domain-containing protein [Pyrinomonadaceae bacterium]